MCCQKVKNSLPQPVNELNNQINGQRSTHFHKSQLKPLKGRYIQRVRLKVTFWVKKEAEDPPNLLGHFVYLCNNSLYQ